MRPLSRSLTSALPSGRNAKPHGTSRPPATVLGVERLTSPDGEAEVEARGVEEGAGAGGCPVGAVDAGSDEQAVSRAAPAAASRSRVPVVIAQRCHDPANFTGSP